MMPPFAGIDPEFAGWEQSRVLLQPVPYDGTSSWGKGADRGPAAFLEAAENMELYDIETGTEAYRQGIHLFPPLPVEDSPESMIEAVRVQADQMIQSGKLPTFLGGEHSITIGILRAFAAHYPGLSVLQVDAHADLRPEYEGTACNHACAVYEASRTLNLVQVGIRSMDQGERKYLNPEQCYTAEHMHGNEEWMPASISQLKDPVYITLDLDALDPSIMPATGTPEPGGLHWYPLLQYLKRVFRERTVVGFDIVELAPIENQHAPSFLAAKLYYKMLSYYFTRHES